MPTSYTVNSLSSERLLANYVFPPLRSFVASVGMTEIANMLIAPLPLR